MWNEKHKEEFKNDAEIFSKAAKSIDELLETTREEREFWLQCQDDFQKALAFDNMLSNKVLKDEFVKSLRRF